MASSTEATATATTMCGWYGSGAVSRVRMSAWLFAVFIKWLMNYHLFTATVDGPCCRPGNWGSVFCRYHRHIVGIDLRQRTLMLMRGVYVAVYARPDIRHQRATHQFSIFEGENR
jgi:hypothetical protein